MDAKSPNYRMVTNEHQKQNIIKRWKKKDCNRNKRDTELEKNRTLYMK